MSTKIGANLLVQIQKIEVFQESGLSWTGMSGCAGDGGQSAFMEKSSNGINNARTRHNDSGCPRSTPPNTGDNNPYAASQQHGG
ncbi:MAG: hypothetical protein ACKO3T_09565 [Planctomycetaceae bacterium]